MFIDNMTSSMVTDRRIRLAIFLFPLVLIALNLLAIPGYTGDDAYIHFTYARNLIEHGTISYNTSNPTYGSTSLLWVFLCSTGSLLIGDIPLTGRILSGLLLVASAILLARYLAKIALLPARFVWSGILLFLVNAVLFRWMLTGMETGLTLFVVAFLLNYWAPERPIRNALCTLVAYLVRPEFVLLPIAYAVVAYFDRQQPRKYNVVQYLLTAAVLFAAWYACAFLYFGSLLPLTSLKSGSGIDVESFIRIVKIVGGMYPDLLLILLILIITKNLTLASFRGLPLVERVLLLFSVGVLGMYLLKGTSMISRYLIIIHPALILLFLRFFAAKPVQRWLPRVALFIMIIQTALFLVVHYRPIRSFVEGFQKVYATMGRQIERTSVQDTGAVMLADVGIMGYYSRRPVIDLAGLTSMHIYESGTGEDRVLLSRYRPQYVVSRLVSPSIDSCTTQWKAASRELQTVTVKFHDRIGPLGVLARSDGSFEVYLLKLIYKE